ncbi:MAG: nucleotidyltransferase family protein [Magnetospirillum sp.]|nr:nucleotidyltransferase family protein [Magnetospirillum sp.]
MRPSEAIARHRDALLEIARRHGVSNVRVFGSVIRGEDGDGSDIDLLVDAGDETSLFDLAAIAVEAESLTGIPVDVRTPLCLSPRFRDDVERHARPL